MKKILLFNLLLAMTFVTTSLKAADGEVFTATVTVIEEDGTTKAVPMHFKVKNPVWWVFDTGSKEVSSCVVSCTYDEFSGMRLPSMNINQRGKVIIPQIVMGPEDGVTPYYSVVGIGDYAFEGCSFSEIELPEPSDYIIHNTEFEIGQDAFYKSLIKDLYIPDNCRISNTIVRSCASLSSISIYGLGTLYENFFSGCTSLKSVEFRTPVTEIQSKAFENCPKLESISFPEGLEKIRTEAFDNCDYLRTVSLPSTLKTIEGNAFHYCVRLGDIIIKSETPPTIESINSVNLIINGWKGGIHSPDPVLYVPDKTKYAASEDWTENFGVINIKSFLPTNEKTYAFYNLGTSGWGWPVYTNDPNKVLNFKVDGEPKAPTFHGTDLIVSDDPKQIPLEVSFLLKTDEGIQPYIIHYDLFDYGFSIDGKEMTSRDFYNVPGVVSGNAYIKDEFVLGGANHLHWKKEPTLVLDNATLEWDTNAYGLSNHDLYQGGLTIKVIGDCTIRVPNAYAAFELDVATVTHITGGGTLHILSKGNGFESWVVANLIIQDNTTVIAESTDGRGYYEHDVANLEIKDGGTFCAYSKYEPFYIDSDLPVFGEGIDIRYPVGAYFSGNSDIYYADGKKVQGDWVVIGPDNQKTWDLITASPLLTSPKEEGQGYNMAGQKVGSSYRGIVIKDGKKILRK